MIVAAGLIGLAQARLPRPIRHDRDRVNVKMSAITRLIPSSIGAEPASIGRVIEPTPHSEASERSTVRSSEFQVAIVR
jgi:hypothetical protein